MNSLTALNTELLMTESHDDALSDCTEKADAIIIKKVLAGDETAFHDIFEKYKRLVAAAAGRYFRQADQIEEIVQITFSKAFFDLKKFRGKYDLSLASWLVKIATNACLDILKKHKTKPESLVLELSAEENEHLLSILTDENRNFENILIEKDFAEKILAHLHPLDRALLQMLHSEEMSVSEISKITGWSKPNIKVRACRARRALRKVLHKLL